MPTKKSMEEVADGIFVEPVPISLGDDVKIKYRGILAANGAQKVYLHAGYGHGTWKEVKDIPMRKTRDGGFSASLKIEDASCLNFCFKDEAENWDNNYGHNWVYEIHDGDRVHH